MGDQGRSKNRLLERLAWGSFLIGVGLLYLTKGYFKVDLWGPGLVLAGGILLVLNLTRAAFRVRVSSGSLGTGVVFLLVGVALIRGIRLNWVALVLLIVGVWVILDALAKKP